MDEITGGKTVSVALKHVERNAHKKEGAEVKPIPEKKAVVSSKKPATEEVKREPKQSFKMNSHYIVRKCSVYLCCRSTTERKCLGLRETMYSQTMPSY